jgi:hypothetical protein
MTVITNYTFLLYPPIGFEGTYKVKVVLKDVESGMKSTYEYYIIVLKMLIIPTNSTDNSS